MTAGRQSVSTVKDWNTPPEYAAAVKIFFDGMISLDPCSNEYSFVNAIYEYKLPHKNGLCESWDYSTIYVNPPYGRDSINKTSIKNWLEKCSSAHREYKSEIIALIPVATNTRHWQNNVFLTASSICFLKAPRLRFWLEGKLIEKGSPMACCLVYWGLLRNKFENQFSSFGKVIHI